MKNNLKIKIIITCVISLSIIFLMLCFSYKKDFLSMLFFITFSIIFCVVPIIKLVKIFHYQQQLFDSPFTKESILIFNSGIDMYKRMSEDEILRLVKSDIKKYKNYNNGEFEYIGTPALILFEYEKLYDGCKIKYKNKELQNIRDINDHKISFLKFHKIHIF